MLIHVACPNCSEPYDIADTFAGGVYRCTKCNTLMSVPKKHTPPAATNLAPGMGKAASPDDLDALGDASSRASSSKASAKAGSRMPAKATVKPGAKPAAKAPLKPGQKAPPPSGLAAYKWHLVSFAVLLVVVVIVVIVLRAKRGETQVETTTKSADVVRRPESNYVFPYAIGVLVNDKPNVLGLPLTGNVAVVIDGSSDINGIRPALHKLLEAGLTNKPYEKPSASFVYATGAAGDKVPSFKAMPANAADGTKRLQDFFSKVAFVPSKRDDPAALKDALQVAVNQALENQTRHVVLVVGRNLSPYAQNQLLSVMDAAFTNFHTHFDMVVVDADLSNMAVLRDQVTASQGRTILVTATMLQTAAGSVK